jgi:hypothetical protein
MPAWLIAVWAWLKKLFFKTWSDEVVRPGFQMHPDALIVRTQVYHSGKKIVTLIGEVF